MTAKIDGSLDHRPSLDSLTHGIPQRWNRGVYSRSSYPRSSNPRGGYPRRGYPRGEYPRGGPPIKKSQLVK